MEHKARLLSTALLDQRLIDKANEVQIALDAFAFIHVSVLNNSELHEQLVVLQPQSLVVVFTSANAVRAVGESIHAILPFWQVYCIGNATKSAVLEYADHDCIRGTANDAAGLAALIRQSGVEKVVFFCGDKRMDTLSLLLNQSGIAVDEVIVYTTEETPLTLSNAYDGILFFSPSAVNSFFRSNVIAGNTALFAIGNTTAAAVKEYTDTEVTVSSSSAKDQLVMDAINYFTQR